MTSKLRQIASYHSQFNKQRRSKVFRTYLKSKREKKGRTLISAAPPRELINTSYASFRPRY